MRRSGGMAAAFVVLSLAARIAGAQAQGQRAKVTEALNRLTWGIAPGQVQEVERIGLQKWIEQQLHPDRIPENPVLVQQLQVLAGLRETPAQEMADYPSAQAIRQMELGKRRLPRNDRLRDIVETEIARDRLRRDAGRVGPRAPARPSVSGLKRRSASFTGVAERGPAPVKRPGAVEPLPPGLSPGTPRQQAAALEAMGATERARVMLALDPRLANRVLPWLPLAGARELLYEQRPQAVPAFDLDAAKVLRAAETNRQLQDVLTDFWFNHFNVFIRKGNESAFLASYLRQAIRPHVFGKFHDLLLATAETPAMMFYLDNWRSVDPHLRGRGINENYGRELMELQTLGVDSGYTQQDVIQVADCFTGWTIRQPGRMAMFYYNDRLHDHAAKVVLGVRIKAGGGMSDGLKVLAMLAASPATAHHVSYELAQRFVADQPPPALVDRMTQTWLHTGGDLRKVMQTMLQSPEFWNAAAARAKMKSPLQMVVSSVRALGADVSNPMVLAQIIANMGEPLYAKEPPTGYT
ncbi:MAG: DUF1800 domain-containing protein, partial [Terriglobales bacterium]